MTVPAQRQDNTRKQRQALQDAGLRRVELWVPDTRKPGFDEECRRQSVIASASDAEDADLLEFMDQALADMDLHDK